MSIPVVPKSLIGFRRKLEYYNYDADMTIHANPCGAVTTWVV